MLGACRFQEAVRECNSALVLAPSSTKALVRRAKALEQQGQYKKALSDMQVVNRTEAANDDTRDTERRLREVMSGRRPASAAAGNGQKPGVGATVGLPFTAVTHDSADADAILLCKNGSRQSQSACDSHCI